MKLYHGTSEWRAKCIEDEGFIGGELSTLTTRRHVEDGVVYMATTAEEAAEYGDVVFEIDITDTEVFPFSDGNSDHFYAYADAIRDHALCNRL